MSQTLAYTEYPHMIGGQLVLPHPQDSQIISPRHIVGSHDLQPQIIEPNKPPEKPKKASRPKRPKQSLKQRIHKLEAALNVQHTVNIMSYKSACQQKPRYTGPPDVENEFLDALEDEMIGCEPLDKNKLDIYTRQESI